MIDLTFISFRLGTVELDIYKYDIYRGPNIGIYGKANDRFLLLPSGFAHTKAKTLAGYLKADYLFTSVAGTRVLGTMMVMNNHGIIIPGISSNFEAEFLKNSTKMDVTVLDTKYSALGNLICTNDKGAIASPKMPKESLKIIQDALGVEVVQKKVAGYHQAGAMICANNVGGIIHPETDEDDIREVSSVLKVKIEPATINGGIPYVSSGILANNNAVVTGNLTNGPEIMMLTRAFTE
jgi:translation initiation factor 6